MAEYVLTAGQKTPDKIALSILGKSRAERWSYARLTTAIRATAAGFAALGLHLNDRILLRLGNSVDFPIAYLGAIAGGFIPVPTSAEWTAEEVTKILPSLAPKLILNDDHTPCPTDHAVPVMPLKQLQALRDGPLADFHRGDPNRLGYIVYTSGTSGRARAVGHAHRAVWARRMMIRDWYDLGPEDRMMHAGAFNWTFTMGTGLMDPWAVGGSALIPAPDVPADMLPVLMRRADVTVFAAAPGVYRKFLQHPQLADLPKLRHGLCAGEKMPAATAAAWETATGGKRVFEAFGMSECSTFISASPQRPAPTGALGYPQRGRRVAIIQDGAPVAKGAPGVIAIDANDPGLMLGYLDAPEESAAKIQNGWFLTGDMGQMADDGAITYLGRDDDMMNAGGFRVSPIEVERALIAHPNITEVATCAVEVKADVQLIAAFFTADQPLPEDDLNKFAALHLARYKQPRIWVQMDALPKGPNGKLSRRVLRETYAAQREGEHDQA